MTWEYPWTLYWKARYLYGVACESTDVDWRRGEVCICKGVVAIASNGKRRMGRFRHGLSSARRLILSKHDDTKNCKVERMWHNWHEILDSFKLLFLDRIDVD